MRIPINVIDLDSTLVDFDTFKRLIIREMKSGNLAVILITMIRLLRLSSATNFKKLVQIILIKKHDAFYFSSYAKEIYNRVNPQVIKVISKYSKIGVINILLSASPDIYVSEVAKLMKWKGKGSHFIVNEQFYHMYSRNKINWITENFPIETYDYNMVISDSKSDLEAFTSFKFKVLWAK